jgi:DNA-directed RNA polymerase specialized sigma24 family protein
MADDARSFDEFYRATSRRLMHFAYAMTCDLATAQDLTQDAYMRAWRHWQHVGSLDRPESWLRVRIQFGFCAVCLSRQHRDGRTWADGDDCVLAVKGGVVFPRTPHGPRRLGRYARGGWEQP